MSLDWIYWAISAILLFWHSAWEAVGVPTETVLGTNWPWILAIVFVVVTVRVILFPLFVKQIKSQRALQKIQPKVKALQEKHKNDRESLQRELMALYKEEKANPLMGCLPMFLQVPVFLGLFWVLRRIDPWQTKNTTLYGWSQAEWDSAAVAKLFGAPIAATFNSPAKDLAAMGASGITVKVVAGILVLIMITTTYLTTRQMILKTGWSEDPQQRMVQRLMLYVIPATLLFSGAIFPVGVIIYWVVNNLVTLGQQQWVLRKFPPAALTPGKAGAVPAATRARGPVATKAGGPRGRAKGEPQTKPAIDGKALAPRPGAKPVHPKKGRPAKRKG